MISLVVMALALVGVGASGAVGGAAATGGTPWYVTLAYLFAAAAFVLSLKWLSSPKTARRGVLAGELGMAAGILATLCMPVVTQYTGIILAALVGTAIGIPLAVLMPMTAVPQRTALSHAFGALAAALVGTAKYYLLLDQGQLGTVVMIAIMFESLLGYLTFTGSLVAFSKLQELKFIHQFSTWVTTRIGSKNLNLLNFATFGLAVILAIWLVAAPTSSWIFPIFIILALLFGWMLVSPIGGADMPTVISLLNSYAGLSASAMGFVLDNKLLIIAGALDGSSGFILSVIMCKAMNRSFFHVLFGQIQASKSASADEVYGGKIKSVNPEDVAMVLDGAQRVVIVPGYGMAVAQAQHATRDLFNLLEERGVQVEFAIHPVAGRMPGHMNVLLAEADIPYDRMKEMDEINPQFEEVDVVIVNGANDVVNPDARDNPNSPIAGMPVLNVDKARSVVVIKRSLSPGFAGIPNPLFAKDNCLMYFADGKKAILDLVVAMKEEG